MLKRVKRRASKQQSLEKTEDFSNSGKKEGPSEIEVLQQVIAELRTEVNALKEQLEKEKKATSDAKSLKTQQVSTLTSKLANAVRQREKVEEELAKVKKEMEELKEELKVQAEERKAKESQDETDSHRKQDENSTELCHVEETGEVNKQDNSNAIDNDIVLSCLEKDESNLEDGNKNDLLSTEDSLHEFSSKEELCQSFSLTEISLSSSSELGDDFSKENSSIQDNHLEVLQISSPEMYDSNYATLSFESQEENQEEITETLQESKKIQEDLCKVQESASAVPNLNHVLAKDVKNVDERRQQILEEPIPSSARKNKRICAQNSDESSPPTSPEAVSSGYTSNSTDENLVKLLMHHGMARDHSAAMISGNDGKKQELYPKGFFNEYEKDDVTSGTKRVQDKKGLEDFIKREEASGTGLKENCKTLEEGRLSSKNKENDATKGVRKSSEHQKEFLPQTMSVEVWDLKQQLKNALKEIEELRAENKEMKKEIRNLSSSAAEEEFLLKTTKFTDRLLREMKERESRVHVPRGLSVSEKYGLEREYSCPGITELSQLRATRDMNRSAARKTSLPLKIIGAKLKELTRSVENMATDPELCEETFSDVCAPGLVGYKLRHPSLNDHIDLEELLVMPKVSSETPPARRTPFKHEKLGGVPRGGSCTSVEKLGEERFLAPSKTQLQFTEEDGAWKENRFQVTDRRAQERSGFDSPCNKWKLHSDTRDYVQRYIVRSSDHIAKMRDLTPEEIEFYSKLLH
ncbi:hypothetical protein ACROYT_G010431 [Oculina patagonica]